ncbi:glycosyl hydrolase, partial [bacterium]|nr:glycosyl hydrolase [bacterium]
QYIKDLVSVLKEYGWHRAFYSFREEEWDGMDYELGTGPTPPGYWTEVEKGNPFPGKKFYKPNPLFQAIIQR